MTRRGYEEAREARTVRTCETNHGTHGLRLSPLLLLTALHVLPSPLVTHLRPSSFGSCLVSEVRREERAVSRMNDTRRRTEEGTEVSDERPVCHSHRPCLSRALRSAHSIPERHERRNGVSDRGRAEGGMGGPLRKRAPSVARKGVSE